MSDEKKVVRPFEFLSLSKKIKSYTYPIQQQNRLVLKINESGIGFRKEFTENNMILRQASLENLTETLGQVNDICNKVYLRSRTEETRDFNAKLSKFLNFACL